MSRTFKDLPYRVAERQALDHGYAYRAWDGREHGDVEAWQRSRYNARIHLAVDDWHDYR